MGRTNKYKKQRRADPRAGEKHLEKQAEILSRGLMEMKCSTQEEIYKACMNMIESCAERGEFIWYSMDPMYISAKSEIEYRLKQDGFAPNSFEDIMITEWKTAEEGSKAYEMKCKTMEAQYSIIQENLLVSAEAGIFEILWDHPIHPEVQSKLRESDCFITEYRTITSCQEHLYKIVLIDRLPIVIRC